MRQTTQRGSSRFTRAQSVHATKTPMTAKVIPSVDQRVTPRPPIIAAQALSPGGAVPDTRDRLTTKGKPYTRFFAQPGHGFRTPMPSGKSGEQFVAARGLIRNQPEDRYSEICTEETARAKEIEMSCNDG